jgi:hypothetical protein
MPTNSTGRPLPRFPEPDTASFWEATQDRQLTYQICRNCAGTVFYPRRHCTHCTSGELEIRKSAGRGSIYSFTVIRRSGHPYFRTRTPYVVALIDLDEGFRMLAEVLSDGSGPVAVDQHVRLDWESYEELNVPVFRPLTE